MRDWLANAIAQFNRINTGQPSQQDIESSKKMREMMTNAVIGGFTMPPVPRGDIAFAQRLANKERALQSISLPEYETLIKIAKQNLQIPKKIFNKMSTGQILQELLSLRGVK